MRAKCEVLSAKTKRISELLQRYERLTEIQYLEHHLRTTESFVNLKELSQTIPEYLSEQQIGRSPFISHLPQLHMKYILSTVRFRRFPIPPPPPYYNTLHPLHLGSEHT